MNGHFEDQYEKVPPRFGQRLAEAVADLVGSWRFIIIQSIALMVWIYLNDMHVIHSDPYPFILLNLLLSLQAAYTAPMILMAQNRQNERDRKALYGDFELDFETHERMKVIEQKLDQLLKQKGE